ncbi:MAG: hypothetical protein B6V02_03745 [Thermoprotei archaeon ex4572_64]|nr:MAG: hypothetical protein B6V02_03745 [Thermoprotei archaeon ex4572_64]
MCSWFFGRGQGRGYGRGGGGGGWGRRKGWGRDWTQHVQSLPNLEPVPNGCERVAAGVDTNHGLNSPLSPRFGRAPYILVIDVCNGEIKNVRTIENTLLDMPRGVGVAITQWLINNGVKIIIASSIGPHVEELISQAGLKVMYAESGIPVMQVLRSYGLVRS